MDPGEPGNEDGRLPPDGPDFDDQGFAKPFDSDDDEDFDTDDENSENGKTEEKHDQDKANDDNSSASGKRTPTPPPTGLPTPEPTPKKAPPYSPLEDPNWLMNWRQFLLGNPPNAITPSFPRGAAAVGDYCIYNRKLWRTVNGVPIEVPCSHPLPWAGDGLYFRLL